MKLRHEVLAVSSALAADLMEHRREPENPHPGEHPRGR